MDDNRKETFLERQRRRDAERKHVRSPWLKRAEDGALYGYDDQGRPVGKVLA